MTKSLMLVALACALGQMAFADTVRLQASEAKATLASVGSQPLVRPITDCVLQVERNSEKLVFTLTALSIGLELKREMSAKRVPLVEQLYQELDYTNNTAMTIRNRSKIEFQTGFGSLRRTSVEINTNMIVTEIDSVIVKITSDAQGNVTELECKFDP